MAQAYAGLAASNVGALLLFAHWGPAAAAGAFVFRGYVTLPFMPLDIARLPGVPAARQYGVFAPIAIAACVMVAAQQAAITIFAHRAAAPLLLVIIAVTGAMAFGTAIYLLDKRALRKGLSALRHLQPQQAPL